MWRALFLAIGFSVCILGLECLAVEKFILRAREEVRLEEAAEPQPGPRKEIAPPGWAPFSFLGLGSVVVVYSFTIPRRVKGG